MIPIFFWCTPAATKGLPVASRTVSASIAAENTFTAATQFNSGYVRIKISGTFSATVVLQESEDNSTWIDVSGGSWTAPAIANHIFIDPSHYLRIGVKTGGYTSGTAEVKLSQ